MSLIHKGKKITLNLTLEQFEHVAKLAAEKGLTEQNYLRFMLGFPTEKQGTRKDLGDRDARRQHMAKGVVQGCQECIQDLRERDYDDTTVCSHQH